MEDFDLDPETENPWFVDLDKKYGDWRIVLDHPGVVTWYNTNTNTTKSEISLRATPAWNGDDTTDVALVFEDDGYVSLASFDKGIFGTFEEYLEYMKPVIKIVEETPLDLLKSEDAHLRFNDIVYPNTTKTNKIWAGGVPE